MKLKWIPKLRLSLLMPLNTTNIFLNSIVGDCRCLLESFEVFTLNKEANGCVDVLAKAGCTKQVDFISFTIAPRHVLEALAFNCSATSCIQLVNC